MLFALLPAVLYVAAALLMFRYSLTRARVAEIHQQLQTAHSGGETLV